MELSVPFEAHPGRALALVLFKDVKNGAELEAKLMGGEMKPEVAMIDATKIPGVLPVSLAAHKALTSEERGKLTTRTLHSELVYNCSGSKHISSSLKVFGFGAQCMRVLVGRFDASPEDLAAIRAMVEGEEVPVAEIAGMTDEAALRKHIKATAEELSHGTLCEALCMRIAARDCM